MCACLASRSAASDLSSWRRPKTPTHQSIIGMPQRLQGLRHHADVYNFGCVWVPGWCVAWFGFLCYFCALWTRRYISVLSVHALEVILRTDALKSKLHIIFFYWWLPDFGKGHTCKQLLIVLWKKKSFEILVGGCFVRHNKNMMCHSAGNFTRRSFVTVVVTSL